MKNKEKSRKIPIQNETFQTNLNLITLIFPYKKNEKKNLKSEKIFQWRIKRNQEKIPIQNNTFQTNWICLHLLFHTKKVKKKI